MLYVFLQTFKKFLFSTLRVLYPHSEDNQLCGTICWRASFSPIGPLTTFFPVSRFQVYKPLFLGSMCCSLGQFPYCWSNSKWSYSLPFYIKSWCVGRQILLICCWKLCWILFGLCFLCFFFFSHILYSSPSLFFFLIILLLFLAMPCGMWDLSSLARDTTYTLCLGSTES